MKTCLFLILSLELNAFGNGPENFQTYIELHLWQYPHPTNFTNSILIFMTINFIIYHYTKTKKK